MLLISKDSHGIVSLNRSGPRGSDHGVEDQSGSE